MKNSSPEKPAGAPWSALGVASYGAAAGDFLLDDGEPDVLVVDELVDCRAPRARAWIEALLPGGDGEPAWVPADPTNRTLGGESHVKIGHGRFYADVPPIKGVFRGAGEAELSPR